MTLGHVFVVFTFVAAVPFVLSDIQCYKGSGSGTNTTGAVLSNCTSWKWNNRCVKVQFSDAANTWFKGCSSNLTDSNCTDTDLEETFPTWYMYYGAYNATTSCCDKDSCNGATWNNISDAMLLTFFVLSGLAAKA